MTTLEVRLGRPGDHARAGRTALVGAAALVTLATLCFVAVTAVRLIQAAPRAGGWHWGLLAVAAAGALGALLLIRPVVHAFRLGQRAREAVARDDVVAARRDRSRARSAAWLAIGSCAAAVIGDALRGLPARQRPRGAAHLLRAGDDLAQLVGRHQGLREERLHRRGGRADRPGVGPAGRTRPAGARPGRAAHRLAGHRLHRHVPGRSGDHRHLPGRVRAPARRRAGAQLA